MTFMVNGMFLVRVRGTWRFMVITATHEPPSSQDFQNPLIKQATQHHYYEAYYNLG